MDRFELCFDAVWETGYWYEQVIRRLGGCTVVQHFLVLCGLGEDTTLRELAIAIYGPYLLARSNFLISETLFFLAVSQLKKGLVAKA